MGTRQPANYDSICMSLDKLRQDRPDIWISEVLKQREEQRYADNKEIVRELLITHDAEDLIPMLLED
jgi:hypothetical protein